jgi:hypothetical protein
MGPGTQDRADTRRIRFPLARRVYDLCHACVSTWLSAGVPSAQVAAWAGHSIAVLLRIYAKYIDGQDQLNKRRIQDVLGDQSDDATDGKGEDNAK